jgi:allantoinase
MIIRGTRVLTDTGLRPATIHVHDGVIVRVGDVLDTAAEWDVVEAGDDIVMPGLVDTHVHVNEPGRTEWEGFASATRAAAAGGVTTIFDMPLNSIPATTTIEALHIKRVAAINNASVNVGFIGGVVPGNSAELPALHREGVTLFKCFLVPSGVDEFEHVTEADLREAMSVLTALDATLMVHAELPGYIAASALGDPRQYHTYLSSRPATAEREAVAMIIRLARQYGTSVHIVHVSSPASLPLISEARAHGVRITCETCPHYLSFSAEDIPDGATVFKCAPPIRQEVRRNMLWHGVMNGDIDMIVSDHSPCPPEMKASETGDFFRAWGGIASLQLGLSAVWTEGRTRGMPETMLVARMSRAPAQLARLGQKKGRLAQGYDADIVIWNPDATFAVNAHSLYHRHAITPYHGRVLHGKVRATFVNGIEVFRDGAMTTEGAGRLLPGTSLTSAND